MINKDFLGFENARNKRNAALYERLLKKAVPGRVAVLIGHHLTFEVDGDLNTENEVPSADCLMFDHEIMGKVFGSSSILVMQQLAAVPCGERDLMLAKFLDEVERMEARELETVEQADGRV